MYAASSKILVGKPRTTAYSADGGIDVILDSTDGPIGVQVKRYKKERRIEAEQIRSLAGALVESGFTKGNLHYDTRRRK